MKTVLKRNNNNKIRVTMTIKQAAIIREFFAPQKFSDTEEIINKYGLDLNADKTEDVLCDLYQTLGDIEDREEIYNGY